jgi:hypothetical protein
MPLLQYTYIFDIPGHGFTETHWRDGGSGETLAQAFDIGQELGRKRQAMSGGQCILQALRISNADIDGRIGTSQLVAVPGVSSKGCAASNVAMNILIADANNQHQKTTQLRGFWDDEEITGGSPVKSGDFNNAFTAWAQFFVIRGFGWRGVATTQEFPIIGYTVNDAGVVSLEVSGNLEGVLPLNKPKSVRIAGLNGGKSQINGQQVVIATNISPTAATIKLKFPMAAVPFAGIGFLRVQSKTFYPALNLSIQRIGNRQAGAPLLRSRGRGPKRIRV